MLIELEQYRLIVESSPNMIWRANLTTECDYFNKTWLEFTGRTYEQEKGFGWAECVHPDDFERCVKIYLENFKNQTKFEMDYRLKRHDGQYRWINDRGVPIYDQSGVFLGFIGSCMDITEKVEGQILKKMAQQDALCNIHNRQYSLQLLEEAYIRAIKRDNPFCILMLDIDDFKTINDLHGHATGDKVLAHVADICKRAIRDHDIVGRYGGDEFLIGLVDTNLANALLVAKRINEEVVRAIFMDEESNPLRISVSVGVKQLTNERDLNSLINEADINLYKAKKRGKNLVVFE